jgi:hypothetical protein
MSIFTKHRVNDLEYWLNELGRRRRKDFDIISVISINRPGGHDYYEILLEWKKNKSTFI